MIAVEAVVTPDNPLRAQRLRSSTLNPTAMFHPRLVSLDSLFSPTRTLRTLPFVVSIFFDFSVDLTFVTSSPFRSTRAQTSRGSPLPRIYENRQDSGGV